MRIGAAIALALRLAVSGAVVFTAQGADGKSSYESPYGYEKTWNAALRLVRVDMGMKVLEKDDANGYLLFEYRSTEGGTKPTNGSFEFIRSSSPQSNEVHVVAQLSPMPRYHEQVLLDHLSKKMHDEYGEPPDSRQPDRRQGDAPDAGVDAGDEYGN